MCVLCEGSVVASNVKIAKSFMARFKGLMGRKKLDEGEGLLLTNCPSIHCFFMKISIDAIYLSKGMEVLKIQTLHPWSIGAHVKNAAHVLELAEGAADVPIGAVLEFGKTIA